METGGHIPIQGNAQVIKMGEDKAFDFFFRKHYAALCYFANSIINNEAEAKDIVQESFIKLWDSHTINERTETVKSFLYTVVRNKCLDLLRKRKVISKAKLKLVKNDNTDFECFDEVAFAEMMRQILDQIADLPSRMQKVVKMYYMEGKNYKSIAEELHTSPETVRKQRQIALQRLRQKLLSFFSIIW